MNQILKMPDGEQVFKDATPTPIPGTSICFPTIEQLIKVTPFKGNRLFRLRVKKMLKHWKTQLPTHFIFGVVRIRKELEFTLNGEDYTYNAGNQLIDGNTRCEGYRMGDLDIPDHNVICIVFDIDDAASLQDLYDSYDADAAAKTTAEGIQSALETLNLLLDTKPLILGAWSTALRTSLNGEAKGLTTLSQVAYFKDELSKIDKSKIFKCEDPALNVQMIKALALIVAKVYNCNNRCMEGLRRIASIKTKDLDTTADKWDGITAILYEWLQGRKDERHFVLRAGFRNKTQFAQVEEQMNFLLYAFDIWMQDRPLDKSKGWKPSYMEDVYTETLADMFEANPIDQ